MLEDEAFLGDYDMDGLSSDSEGVTDLTTFSYSPVREILHKPKPAPLEPSIHRREATNPYVKQPTYSFLEDRQEVSTAPYTKQPPFASVEDAAYSFFDLVEEGTPTPLPAASMAAPLDYGYASAPGGFESISHVSQLSGASLRGPSQQSFFATAPRSFFAGEGGASGSTTHATAAAVEIDESEMLYDDLFSGF